MEGNKYKLNLTDIQKRKLRVGYKKQKLVVLSFKKDQLRNGNVDVLLTDQQYRQVQKALKNNTGVRLILDYRQIKSNVEGGLLKEILEMAENNIPQVKRFVSPLIKEKIAPLLKNQFVPWLKSLVDNELDELMKKDATGEGLKKLINRELNRTLSSVRKN